MAELYPDMVGYDKDGQPSSIKYQALAPMLLNEVQKQHAQIQTQAQIQQQENQKLEEQNRQQAEQIRSLEDRLAALQTLLSGQTSTATRPSNSQ